MPSTQKQLPLPSFYDPATAAQWSYRPNVQTLFENAEQWTKAHGITASAAQKLNIELLLIDYNKDFCFPEGTLFVAGRSGTGAIDDSRRTAEFVYRNLNVISNIRKTFDTHLAFQIFFASFLHNRDDRHPKPHSFVTTEEVLRGDYKVNPKIVKWAAGGNYGWAQQQLQFYCQELEKAGKYKLYLWPFHCLLGTDGHALVGTVMEATLFHNFCRGVQSDAEVKGGNPWTENYSILKPEVLMFHDGRPMAQKNTRFIKTLMQADHTIIAGQAASHCVAASTDDLLAEILAVDPGLAEKVYVLTDCMSAVTVPDGKGKGGFALDCTSWADAAFKRWADAGMHLVKSTDPIQSWPGIRL